MTTLYIIRHAEAEGNLYRRIHGWYNSLITENGYRQIAALAGRFRDVAIDAAYSSDLFRTQTTARAVCEPKGLPLYTRADLREISMGVWEDHTWGEVAKFDAAQYALYSHCDPRWKNRDGESRQEARGRILVAVRDIAARHPGQTVAVFSHGDIIRCLQAEVDGLPVEAMPGLGHCDNTGVTCLKAEDGRLEIAFRNDNAHLSEGISTLARQRWWKDQKNAVADANFWFRPLEKGDEAFFCALHRGTWTGLYGEESGYDAAAFFQDALERTGVDPRWASVAMLGDRPAGVVELHLTLNRQEGAGHIRFLALAPEFRKRGLAPQLLGQAVSIFRGLGREKLDLLCAPGNGPAQRFYVRHGFRKIGERPGHLGPLDQMEKDISYRVRPIHFDEI